MSLRQVTAINGFRGSVGPGYCDSEVRPFRGEFGQRKIACGKGARGIVRCEWQFYCRRLAA